MVNLTPYTVTRSNLTLAKEPLLKHLDIELTERCNNACQHCYINLPSNCQRAIQTELSTAQWRDILSLSAELGTLSVRITGGEPLLRDDFLELYLHARRLGMKVILFTNARRITLEIAKLFSHIPPLEKIQITVYGMRSESYEAVSCSPGSYQEFRQGVQNLIDQGVPFILKGALLPQNKPDIEAFDVWAKTNKWMKERPTYSMFFDLRTRRDSKARNHMIRKLRVSPEEGVAFLESRSTGYRAEMLQFCSRFIGPTGDLLFTCGAGRGGCVDAYGKLQPCMLLRDPAFAYPLTQGSIRDALMNDFPRLRNMKTTNPVYLERCARCFLHGLCEQCPAKSWAEHGTLDSPVEYLCKVAHVQARTLGLLNDGEQGWCVPNWKDRLAGLLNGERS